MAEAFNVNTFFFPHTLQRFATHTHLTCGVDCNDTIPSPIAILRSVQGVPLPLQNEFEDRRRCSLACHSKSGTLHVHESAIIGVGGMELY